MTEWLHFAGDGYFPRVPAGVLSSLSPLIDSVLLSVDVLLFFSSMEHFLWVWDPELCRYRGSILWSLCENSRACEGWIGGCCCCEREFRVPFNVPPFPKRSERFHFLLSKTIYSLLQPNPHPYPILSYPILFQSLYPPIEDLSSKLLPTWVAACLDRE